MWKSLLLNWTTSLPALLAALCGSAELMGLFPDTWERYVVALCTFMLAAGLMAAKSAGVSNAPRPVAAVSVSEEDAKTPNPSAVVPPTGAPPTQPHAWVPIILILGIATVLTACKSSAWLKAQDQIEALVTVYATGDYQVTFTKDGKTLYQEFWKCEPVPEKLPKCHKVNSRTTTQELVPVK